MATQFPLKAKICRNARRRRPYCTKDYKTQSSNSCEHAYARGWLLSLMLYPDFPNIDFGSEVVRTIHEMCYTDRIRVRVVYLRYVRIIFGFRKLFFCKNGGTAIH